MLLKEAWQILNLNYRDLGEVCAQLKEKLMAIKLKATNNTANEVELFYEARFIARIKSMGGTVMQTADYQCIALIGKYLPQHGLRE